MITEQQCYEIAEAACEICRYPGEYKDTDDLIKERCERCPVFEKAWEFCDENESKKDPPD